MDNMLLTMYGKLGKRVLCVLHFKSTNSGYVQFFLKIMKITPIHKLKNNHFFFSIKGFSKSFTGKRFNKEEEKRAKRGAGVTAARSVGKPLLPGPSCLHWHTSTLTEWKMALTTIPR